MLAFILAWGLTLRGQDSLQGDSVADADIRGLAAEVEAAESPEAAVVILEKLKKILWGSQTHEFQSLLKETLYQLGLNYMRIYQNSGNPEDLKKAIPHWQDFAFRFVTDTRYPLALMNLGDCAFAVGDYEEAIKSYRILIDPNYANQLGPEDRQLALARLAQSYRELGNWDAAMPLLWDVAGSRDSPDLRLFALNTLFDGYLETDRLNQVTELFPLITRDPLFRFDLGLNLRLLMAGDALEEEEDYARAGLFYSMVLPLESLQRRVEDALIELEEILFTRQFLANREEELRAGLERLRASRVELLAGPQYTADLRWRQARVLRELGRHPEAYFAFERLMRQYTRHPQAEQFHYAVFLQALQCGYVDEAVSAGESYLEHPHYLIFEKQIAAQMASLYLLRQQTALLAALADDYLHRFPDDPVSAQMTHTLGQAWFREGEIERLQDDFGYWLDTFPDGAFADSALYWKGMAALYQGDFATALACFDRVETDFPGSVYLTEVRFRRGVCHFGMGDHPEALALFTAWVAANPAHPLRPEGEAFLGDLAAMDARVDEAMAHYARVEPLGGSEQLIDHATFEGADLLVANRRWDELRAWLEAYLQTHGSRPEAAEAVLQLAEADRAEGRLDEAFVRYEDAMVRFGNSRESDAMDRVAEAWWDDYMSILDQQRATLAFARRLADDNDFRRSMTEDRIFQLNWFRENQAVESTLADAFTRDKAFRDTVARMDAERGWTSVPLLAEAVERASARRRLLPDAPPSEAFLRMRDTAREEGATTLALRLWRVLNLREGVEADGNAFGPDEEAAASPAVLVWIAGLKRDLQPLEAFDLLVGVTERAPDSEAAVQAYFLLAELETDFARYDRAIALYEQIMDNFPSHDSAVRAALLKGDAWMLSGDYAGAIQAYQDVLARREWRGEPWAEATFKIGNAFAEMGERAKAQGFYERTYLAYGRFEPWGPRAYLESGRVLEMMGDLESARRTYEAFLEQPGAASSSVYEVVRQRVGVP